MLHISRSRVVAKIIVFKSAGYYLPPRDCNVDPESISGLPVRCRASRGFDPEKTNSPEHAHIPHAADILGNTYGNRIRFHRNTSCKVVVTSPVKRSEFCIQDPAASAPCKWSPC